MKMLRNSHFNAGFKRYAKNTGYLFLEKIFRTILFDHQA